MRRLVLADRGVAVLPEYLIADDLKRRRLVRVFRSVRPLPDYFRLIFRADDPRRALFESLAAALRRSPLR